MSLYDRKYSLTVGTLKIEKLDISFKVVKTLKKEPNTLELTVRNLNEEHREHLAQLEQTTCRLEAGYVGDYGLIFSGDVRDITSTKEGTEWLTKIPSGDGERSIQRARINESFAPGTPLPIPIKKLAEKMKVGLGNAALQSLQGNFEGAANEFLTGTVLSGRASTEMDGLLKSAGLEWSIQDGELQLIPIGDVLVGLAVKLAPETGLVGSPTVGNDGVVTFQALLNRAIAPGRSLRIEAEGVPKAFYRAERCEYVGDTRGQDWYVNGEAKAL